ncbi:MAG: hydrogen gas-evolving membrane-bound hydrogenase subunit E [Opitutales bacterium]
MTEPLPVLDATTAGWLLTALLAPWVGFFVQLVFNQRLGKQAGLVAWPFTGLAFAGLLVVVFRQQADWEQALLVLPWIPSLNVNLVFLVDGLSLFFGLVVSGMGCLIFAYAKSYLGEGKKLHHFFAYLLFFEASMLGTVFAGNLMLLFCFWELTGISSFLLIGYLHQSEESRRGARMALLTTVLTGLLMLVGIVILALSTGTLDIATLLNGNLTELAGAEWATVAFVLVVIGAFGKSAQFPFHFWLPNAMAAPTPVSAYLHSATMVKLGVFLVARTFPIFRDLELFGPLLITVGFTTFLIGAVLALLSTKLKGILAYSTVSTLGFLIGFYGISGRLGVHFDFLHILNHVFYKGALFMIVGVIDHATHCKDIRDLGGLGRRVPFLALITILASTAMAGLPGTLGFISKEYMLKEQFAYWHLKDVFLSPFPLTLIVIGSIIKVVFSLRLISGIFFGPMPEKASAHFHKPSLVIMVPPAILAFGSLLFGLFPGLLSPFLDAFRTPGLQAMPGGHYPEGYTLKLWHGITKEFGLSSVIILLGVGGWWLGRRSRWRWTQIPTVLRADLAYDWIVAATPTFAKRLTAVLQADRATAYLPVIASTILVGVGGTWLLVGGIGDLAEAWSLDARYSVNKLQLLIVGLTVIAGLGVALASQWTSQVLALSVVGFLITFYFVLFRAPDLALTQILIESATLILILLLLARFPLASQDGERTSRSPVHIRRIKAVLACAVGLLVAGMTWTMSVAKEPDSVGAWVLANTLDQAKGSNAVNTILVDFRGFDTFMEIAVLMIAVLACLGLLMRTRRRQGQISAGPSGPPGMDATLPDPVRKGGDA